MIRISEPIIGDEEERAVLDVLRSGRLAQGPQVEAFEQEFAEYVGTRYAVAVSSGTAALHLALMAVGVQEDDEVVVPRLSFVATANAVLFTGAKPVFACTDGRSFLMKMTPACARPAHENIKAVIPVHLYGQPCNMDTCSEFAVDRRAFVIEDAAQAHGATFRGRKVGSLGDAGCFSFYATKNMTTGEGGMVTTNTACIAERVKLGRQHASLGVYEHRQTGYNYRMTEMQAAIGRVQLRKLDSWNAARQRNAEHLDALLSDLESSGRLMRPLRLPGREHVFHQYTIICEEQSEPLRVFLLEQGIEAKRFYPNYLYDYPHLRWCQRTWPTKDTQLPKQMLSLPVHPLVTGADLDSISHAVHAHFKKHKRRK